MRENILNLACAKAFDVVPLRSPVILLYYWLFHQRTTNQFHRQSSQITSPSHLHHHWFYEYSTVKDNNRALQTEFF